MNIDLTEPKQLQERMIHTNDILTHVTFADLNTADREQNHILGFPKADKFCDLNFEEEHKIRVTD